MKEKLIRVKKVIWQRKITSFLVIILAITLFFILGKLVSADVIINGPDNILAIGDPNNICSSYSTGVDKDICYFDANLIVNGVLTIQGDPTSGKYIELEVAGDTEVYGEIKADGQGFGAGEGPGAGEDAFNGPNGAGGGHGGRGGERLAQEPGQGEEAEYLEDFSTADKRDPATVANWDTTQKKLYLNSSAGVYNAQEEAYSTQINDQAVNNISSVVFKDHNLSRINDEFEDAFFDLDIWNPITNGSCLIQCPGNVPPTYNGNHVPPIEGCDDCGSTATCPKCYTLTDNQYRLFRWNYDAHFWVAETNGHMEVSAASVDRGNTDNYINWNLPLKNYIADDFELTVNFSNLGMYGGGSSHSCWGIALCWLQVYSGSDSLGIGFQAPGCSTEEQYVVYNNGQWVYKSDLIPTTSGSLRIVRDNDVISVYYKNQNDSEWHKMEEEISGGLSSRNYFYIRAATSWGGTSYVALDNFLLQKPNTNVSYYFSNLAGEVAGDIWYPVVENQPFNFPLAGNNLRWKAELQSLDGQETPLIDKLKIKYNYDTLVNDLGPVEGSGGDKYDSSWPPVEFGSGGGDSNSPSQAAGGAGGGIIKINTGNLLLNGVISADGEEGEFYQCWINGDNECGGGGGGGGTIDILVRDTLSGSGNFEARGGDGGGNSASYGGSGGGGGRIVVNYSQTPWAEPDFKRSTTAGGNGWQVGEHGSMMFYDSDGDSYIVEGFDWQNEHPSDFNNFYIIGSNYIPSAEVTSGLSGEIETLGLNLDITGDLEIKDSSFWQTKGQTIMAIASQAIIHPGSQLIADGGGYPGDLGPGAGIYQDFQGGGGGYGGQGGDASTGAAGGQVYGEEKDNLACPSFLGSGGGSGTAIGALDFDGINDLVKTDLNIDQHSPESRWPYREEGRFANSLRFDGVRQYLPTPLNIDQSSPISQWPYREEGRFVNGLRFDGVRQYLPTPLNIDQNGSTAITMEAWVYPLTDVSGREAIISTNRDFWDWSIYRNGNQWVVHNGENEKQTGIVVEPNQWQHLAAVFTPGYGVKFYRTKLDGTTTEWSDSEITYSQNDGNVTIGRRSKDSYDFFQGKIDDIRIWNKGRTKEEIQATAQQELAGSESDLLAYWKFNETEGSVCEDSSPNNYDAYFVGDPWSTPVTMETWVYPMGNLADRAAIISTERDFWDWGIYRNGNQWVIHNGDEEKFTGISVDRNQWQHVAAVFTPGQGVKFYKTKIDGTTNEWSDSEISYSQNDGNVTIGRRSKDSYDFFQGKIDDIRIWNKGRTKEEIQATAQQELAGSESDLLAYWKFNYSLEDSADGFDAYFDSNNNYIPEWTVGRFSIQVGGQADVSSGGGVLKLLVGGLLDNQGLISARGYNGLEGGGGGSGGSVCLLAAEVANNGNYDVSGGDGITGGGGGGGGRLALAYDACELPNSTFLANGGSGYQAGETGSLYYQSNQPPEAPAVIRVDALSQGVVWQSGDPVDPVLPDNELSFFAGEYNGCNQYLLEEYPEILDLHIEWRLLENSQPIKAEYFANQGENNYWTITPDAYWQWDPQADYILQIRYDEVGAAGPSAEWSSFNFSIQGASPPQVSIITIDEYNAIPSNNSPEELGFLGSSPNEFVTIHSLTPFLEIVGSEADRNASWHFWEVSSWDPYTLVDQWTEQTDGQGAHIIHPTGIDDENNWYAVRYQVVDTNSPYYYFRSRIPWLKTEWGDIYSGGNIDLEHSPAEEYNATYCIFASGDSIQLSANPEFSACRISDFQTLEMPQEDNKYYSEHFGLLDIQGTKARAAAEGRLIEDCNFNNPLILAGRVYYCQGDLKITNDLNIINANGEKARGDGLIIVEGNLEIEANITYGSSSSLDYINNLASLGVMVLKNSEGQGGNIYIDSSVVEIAGAYYAEGVINTCLVGGDCSANQLTVKGLLVAGQFLFNRQFTDEYDSPAEEIIYDGRILANTPPGMYDLVKGLPLWQNY